MILFVRKFFTYFILFFYKVNRDVEFKGVKIYTNLGYFPYDDNLNSIWKYCEKHNIPILAHS